MKTNIIKFGAVSFVLLAVVALIAVTRVAAQTATSSEAVVDATPPTSVPDAAAVSTTEVIAGETPTAEPVALTSSEVAPAAPEVTPIEAAPEGLTKVSIIGTKYIDYFTDGTSERSFPGNPEIDAHLGEKDAPIPTHEGLTWVHTSGMNLYDTQSGDIEEGQYALQQNGRYVAKSLPFVSSTSTPAVLDASTSTEPAPSDVSPDSSTTTSSTGTTTSLIFADDTVAPMAPTDTATTTIP